MDCYWLLTSTFYGNWLPGDVRGFVSRVRDVRGDNPEGAAARGADATPLARHEHDVPGTPYDEDMPGPLSTCTGAAQSESLYRLAASRQRLYSGRFTATYRGWQIRAVAIMHNHFHLVVGVTGASSPTKVLGDFKSYGSRVLNRRWGKPLNGTWWTYDGSKRKLVGEPALLSAIEYVRNQSGALVKWIASKS